MLRTALLSLALLLSTTACIDLGKAPTTRLFEPLDVPFDSVVANGDAWFQLDAVTAHAPIDLAMLWRLSPVEVQRDEDNRWAAAPADLVADRVVERLPQRPGGKRFDLTLALVRFEGVRSEPAAVVVEIAATLSDAEGVVRSRRLHGQAPLAAATPDELARGMGAALDAAVTELVAWLLERSR